MEFGISPYAPMALGKGVWYSLPSRKPSGTPGLMPGADSTITELLPCPNLLTPLSWALSKV